MSFDKIKSASMCLLVSLLSPLAGAQAQCAGSVPASESHMYTALSNAMGTFQTSLDQRPQTASSTPFAAKLDSATAAIGPALLQTGAMQSVNAQLARYQQLGVQGVVIDMSFPLMSQQYFTANPSAGNLQQYTTFYQQVIQQCHQAGMKVLVESHPVYPSATDQYSLKASQYTKSLSATNFFNAMVQQDGTVASLGPDFISIVSEPNTDLVWTNQRVFASPSALAALVQACTQAINTASPTTVAAAGAPNWQHDAQDFDSLLYPITGLGAIDIHVYFAGNHELENATALADSAHAVGKQIVVSESWLSKIGEGTPPVRPEPGQVVSEKAASSYSFWQPLDAQFIYSFFKWCNVEQPSFFAFFCSQLLFANLPYSQVHWLSDAEVMQEEKQVEKQAINADQFTNVGLYYGKLLTAPRQNQY